MQNALTSAVLLAFTIVALFSTRKRGLLAHLLVEGSLLLAIGSFMFAHGVAPLLRDAHFPDGMFGTWLRSLAVIWWLIGARFVVNLTLMTRRRDPKSRDVRLFSELIAAVIYITAAGIILDSVFDLPIRAVLATSGIIAIVLGLALQNTLADVFSGIAVGMEKPFHVGDRVSLGTNVEGTLIAINWRSVRIQTDGEDVATIPNSIVAKGQIINRSVPTNRRGGSVEITTSAAVHSDTVLELMQHAALLCTEILSTPKPTFTLRRSGIASASYAINFFVADSAALLPAKSVLLKQVRRTLHHAGAGAGATAPPSPAELLASVAMFEPLLPQQVEELSNALTAQKLEPGEVVFAEGSIGTSIFIVQAGVLEISRGTQAGASQTLGRIGPGEYIGELGLITAAQRGATVTAITHARVLQLPGESLCELLRSNHALNAAMDRSVRKGLALLSRDAAARESQVNEPSLDLLGRIKAFFAG